MLVQTRTSAKVWSGSKPVWSSPPFSIPRLSPVPRTSNCWHVVYTTGRIHLLCIHLSQPCLLLHCSLFLQISVASAHSPVASLPGTLLQWACTVFILSRNLHMVSTKLKRTWLAAAGEVIFHGRAWFENVFHCKIQLFAVFRLYQPHAFPRDQTLPTKKEEPCFPFQPGVPCLCVME